MHGGYLGIRRARAYLRRSILGSPAAVRSFELVDEIEPTRVRIGVHYRGGTDFAKHEPVKPGVFNISLPVEWYESVINSLVKKLDVPVEVLLASDTESTELAEALVVDGRHPTRVASTSVGDLAALANSDLIVSSVSSFSMLAIFLSDAPYVWHADNLYGSGGWASIWGHEAKEEGDGTGCWSRGLEVALRSGPQRGIPQGARPHWSDSVIRRLRDTAAGRKLSRDLIYYGVVPFDVDV